MAEHERYLQILPQMGLKADMVPADMRKQLYQKLGLTLPEDQTKA